MPNETQRSTNASGPSANGDYRKPVLPLPKRVYWWLREWFVHPTWAFCRLRQSIATGGWHYTYDSEANASYLRVRRGKVARTSESGNGEYVIDFDRWHNIVGIEVLSVERWRQPLTTSTNTKTIRWTMNPTGGPDA